MHTFDVMVRNSVRIQPIGNDGLVLASDATGWRADATLVQVYHRTFCFNFTGQRTYLQTSALRNNKLIRVAAKLARGRNRAHHFASSLLRMNSLLKSIN
jgi:hypothetical protein